MRTTYSMKRLLLLLPVVLLLVLAIPSVVSAEAPVTTWESYVAGVDNSTAVYAGNWVSQTFNVTEESHSVFSVRLRMYRVGEPGTVVVGITEVDGSGLPTGDDLTTGTFNGDYATNNTNGAWYTIPMTETSLNYDTTYAIVVSAESGDVDDAIYVRLDDSAATYAGGSEVTSADGGLSWTADTGNDLMFAISGRALIDVDDVKVFQSYYEDGDLLFAVSYFNTYTPYYPLSDTPSYFMFQLLDTDGSTLLLQTVCPAWGYVPVELYLNADSAAVLDEGDAFVIRLIGLMGEEPSANYTLVADDWKGTNLDDLDTWVINLAKSMEEHYGIDLLVASGSDELLNDQGAVFFLTGMPSLMTERSHLFEVGTYDPEAYEEGTGAFDAATTWNTEVGATITGAVEDTASLLGVDNPQSMAGILLTLGYFLLAGIVIAKGGDMSIAAILAIPVVLAGTQLRVLPFAFIATIAAVAIILLVYRFWWSRT